MTTWNSSTYWSAWIADMGPYLGTAPPLPPYPANVPANCSEVDYYVSDQDLTSVLAGEPPTANRYNAYTPRNTAANEKTSQFYRGVAVANSGIVAGAHLYVFAYPLNGTWPSPAPVEDALTLVPASYVTGGTGYAAPTLPVPGPGAFAIEHAPVTLVSGDLSNPTTSATNAPYGNPTCGVLADGTYIAAVPYSLGTETSVRIRVYHLAADLTVLGTLDLTNAAVWNHYAGCGGGPMGQKYLIVAAPNTANPSLSWVLDCSTPVPTVAATNTFTPATSEYLFDQVSASYSATLDRIVLTSTDNGTGKQAVEVFVGSTGARESYYAADYTDTYAAPGRVYFNPADSSKFTVYSDYLSRWQFSGLGTATLTRDSFDPPGFDFVYGSFGEGSPYEPHSPVVTVQQFNGGSYAEVYDGANSQSAVGVAHLANDPSNDYGAVAAMLRGASVGMWFQGHNDPVTSTYVNKMQVFGVDYHSGSPVLDAFEIEWPSPINATHVESMQPGSFAMDADPTTGKVILVACVDSNYSLPGAPHMNLIVTSITAPSGPVSTPHLHTAGNHAGVIGDGAISSLVDGTWRALQEVTP